MVCSARSLQRGAVSAVRGKPDVRLPRPTPLGCHSIYWSAGSCKTGREPILQFSCSNPVPRPIPPCHGARDGRKGGNWLSLLLYERAIGSVTTIKAIRHLADDLPEKHFTPLYRACGIEAGEGM